MRAALRSCRKRQVPASADIRQRALKPDRSIRRKLGYPTRQHPDEMIMLLAAVFDDQAKAHEGTKALHTFHSDGRVTVYTHALLERGRRRGLLSVREPFHEGMVAAAPAAAALVGALVSLAGGPMTAAMLTLRSGLAGTVRDMIEAGLDPGLFEEIAVKLRPGSFGLVAEVEAEDAVPLVSGMASLGGRIAFQKAHGVMLEELMLREAEALRRSYSRLLASSPQVVSDATGSAMHQANVVELRRMVQRARQHARSLRCEALAKVAVLRAQAGLLDGPAKQQIDARAGRVRTGWEERAQRLDRLVEDMVPLLADSRRR